MNCIKCVSACGHYRGNVCDNSETQMMDGSDNEMDGKCIVFIWQKYCEIVTIFKCVKNLLMFPLIIYIP